MKKKGKDPHRLPNRLSRRYGTPQGQCSPRRNRHYAQQKIQSRSGRKGDFARHSLCTPCLYRLGQKRMVLLRNCRSLQYPRIYPPRKYGQTRQRIRRLDQGPEFEVSHTHKTPSHEGVFLCRFIAKKKKGFVIDESLFFGMDGCLGLRSSRFHHDSPR